MRTLDVIGKYFQLRLGIDARPDGQEQVALGFDESDALRAGRTIDLELKTACAGRKHPRCHCGNEGWLQ